MPQWQYKVVPLQNFTDSPALEQALNTQGAEEWELISISQNGNKFSAIMKKEGAAAPPTTGNGELTNTEPPTLSATTAKPGDQLVCDPGVWSDAAATFAYRWQVDGVDHPQAVTAQHTVLVTEVGTTLACRVTANGTVTADSDGCTVTSARS
jgi:hypothetical protein